MKRILGILFTAMVVYSVTAQNITGQWNGLLKVQGTQLSIVFHIVKTDTLWTATLDSPDQGAKGIAATSVTFENGILKVEVARIGVRYEGALTKDDQIIGEFRQSTFRIPLTLTREVPEKEKKIRPQNPAEPYPYYMEDVTFTNPADQTVLAGTLSLPSKEGQYPVVVLISGSGPQNRDEELFGHKPFLVLADHLTKNGIGVLRYDDRGTAKSTGDFAKANLSILASDVQAAVSYLLTRKEVNKKEIGLVGHSEGGLLAPMVASGNKQVRYLVLLAGPGLRGEELLLLQQQLIGKASGLTGEQLTKTYSINKGAFDIVVNATNQETMRTDLKAYFQGKLKDTPANEKPIGSTDEDLAQSQADQITTPWFRDFLKCDPSLFLEKVKCPVLALNGSKDLQVAPRENLSAIKSALEKGKNKKVLVREFPNLNHLFQECTTGLPSEYGEIEQTISPQVLNEISGWIQRQVK